MLTPRLIPYANRGVAGGVATLDDVALVPDAQLPPYGNARPPATAGFSTDFVAADGTRLGTLGWTEDSRVWEVQSNRAIPTATAGVGIVKRDAGTTNMTVEATFAEPSGNIAGLLGRYVSSTNFWMASINSAANTFELWLRDSDSAVFAVQASASVTIDAGTLYTVRLAFDGTSITATLDGANTLTVTSAIHQTATAYGFRVNSDAQISVDSVEVTVPVPARPVAYPFATGAAIQAAIDDFAGDRGLVVLSGDYAVSATVNVPANVDIVGRGKGARLVSTVTGGPTLHLLGTHTGTAQPNNLSATTSNKQLGPTLANFQIQGNATTVASTCGGILIENAFAPTVRDVFVRECSYGIKVTTRARNVLITGCHLYNNYGRGIHVEDANVHQMQVTDCHVMYNVGGIYVTGGETYNLVIANNVIEYYDGSFGDKLTSDYQHGIYIASDTALILHVVGNNVETSQQQGVRNLWIEGTNALGNEHAGIAAITGNTFSLGNIGVRLQGVTDVALVGNTLLNGTGSNIYSVEAIDSQNVVIAGNAHSANSRYHETSGSAGGILVTGSRIVNISGVTIGRPLDLPPAAIQVTDSDLVSIDAVMVIDPHKVGILLDGTTKNSRVTNCTVLDTRGTKKMTRPIQETGTANSNVISGNRVNDGVTSGIAVVGASTVNSGNHSLEYAA